MDSEILLVLSRYLSGGVDPESILRGPLTFSNNDKLAASFLMSGVHDASSLRIMECFDIRNCLRAKVVFSVATTVFQRVGERMRIRVDRVGTCHHADQGCCSTIAQVFSVTWWIGLSFSVLSSVVDLEVGVRQFWPDPRPHNVEKLVTAELE